MCFTVCFNGTTIEYFKALFLIALYSFLSQSTKFYELGKLNIKPVYPTIEVG